MTGIPEWWGLRGAVAQCRPRHRPREQTQGAGPSVRSREIGTVNFHVKVASLTASANDSDERRWGGPVLPSGQTEPAGGRFGAFAAPFPTVSMGVRHEETLREVVFLRLPREAE